MLCCAVRARCPPILTNAHLRDARVTRAMPGDRSRAERFFGSLKRGARVFFKGINAGRSRIASLDGMNLFFVYYNGLRFHKGIGRVTPPKGEHRLPRREVGNHSNSGS